MAFSNLCNSIFEKSVADYHVTDSVDAPMNNPYELKTIDEEKRENALGFCSF